MLKRRHFLASLLGLPLLALPRRESTPTPLALARYEPLTLPLMQARVSGSWTVTYTDIRGGLPDG